MFDIHICFICIYTYIINISRLHFNQNPSLFSRCIHPWRALAPEARLLPSEVFGEGSMGAHLQRNASARAWSTALGGPGGPMDGTMLKGRFPKWMVYTMDTLQETNISPKNGILKMIFLFPRWDMLISWRVNPIRSLMIFEEWPELPLFSETFI